MASSIQHIVGTSGYSFRDWVGEFYPAGTTGWQMLAYYTQHFSAVELNFTYYRLPGASTLRGWPRTARRASSSGSRPTRRPHTNRTSPISHEFVDNLQPLAEAGKLAGSAPVPSIVPPHGGQPQVPGRRPGATLAVCPLAVEFRHRSWDDPATLEGLRQRNVSLVVPDVPDLADLYRVAPRPPRARAISGCICATRKTGTPAGRIVTTTTTVPAGVGGTGRILVGAGGAGSTDCSPFFNNCHRGQAAANAKAFEEVLKRIG